MFSVGFWQLFEAFSTPDFAQSTNALGRKQAFDCAATSAPSMRPLYVGYGSFPVIHERPLSANSGRSECLPNAFSTSALGPETPFLNCLIDGGAYGRTRGLAHA